jgi:hypothetical protein
VDRVVEVLEAVHLLLAFPLFAVVVAVDPRWLRQSLLEHYPRLLGGTEGGGLGNDSFSVTRPATPQDYLEKVFQVPFNLQPMEKSGFESLIKRLLPTTPEPPKPIAAHESSSEARALNERQQAQQSQGAVVDPQSRTSKASEEPPSRSTASPVDAEKPKESTLAPQRLRLSENEVRDIQRFQPLFQTPRAVKRLANTYCLIRVGVEETEWVQYVGSLERPGAYRVPMLLLAVSSAFPSLARPWLTWLKETTPQEWRLAPQDVTSLADMHADTTDRTEWDGLAHRLEQVPLNGWTRPTSASLEKWVPRVARYSF